MKLDQLLNKPNEVSLMSLVFQFYLPKYRSKMDLRVVTNWLAAAQKNETNKLCFAKFHTFLLISPSFFFDYTKSKLVHNLSKFE